MLHYPELAMPRSRTVTTVCNGKREVWNDYEKAKAYFLKLMISTDGEEHDRAKCVTKLNNHKTRALPNSGNALIYFIKSVFIFSILPLSIVCRATH